MLENASILWKKAKKWKYLVSGVVKMMIYMSV